MDFRDYIIPEIPITKLLKIADETKRDLNIEILADGSININYTIPTTSVSTYKSVPCGREED